MKAGLKDLILDDFSIDDTFLKALAASPAAGTMTSLRLRASVFTDASSDAWKSFTKLQKVDLNRSSGFSMVIIHEICGLNHLKELHVACRQLDSAEVIKCLNSHKRNKITAFTAPQGDSAPSSAFADLLEALRSWPGRSNVTSFVLSDYLNETEHLKLFKLLPKLQKIDCSFYISDLKRHVGSMSGLTDLRLTEAGEDDAEVACRSLANYGQHLTNLLSLSVYNAPSGYSWLANMPHLTNLDLQEKHETDALPETIVWPASLTELAINLEASATPRAVQSLVDHMCKITALRQLSIGQSDKFSLENLQSILASLPNLTRLQVDNGWVENLPAAPQTVTVTHPNLKKLEIYSEDLFFCAKFINAPRLEEVDLGSKVGPRVFFDALNSGDQKPHLPSLIRIFLRPRKLPVWISSADLVRIYAS
jgi:hypothetical protein